MGNDMQQISNHTVDVADFWHLSSPVVYRGKPASVIFIHQYNSIVLMYSCIQCLNVHSKPNVHQPHLAAPPSDRSNRLFGQLNLPDCSYCPEIKLYLINIMYNNNHLSNKKSRAFVCHCLN